MSIYGLRSGPNYRAVTKIEMFESALDLPMSQAATFWDQAKGGAVESFGLGTAIRDFSTPAGAPLAAGRYERPEQFKARRDAFAAENKVLDQEAYKASPYYRDDVPWDASMTEDRAAALATMYDTKKVREHFAEKRPITSFFGNLAGQAVDPINYIPVAGPGVKAAAVARMGVVKGIAATAALDAAANTAIAGIATRETRRGFGDDVSWQMMVSEIATAALLGTAFGTVGGVLERRAGLKADAMRSQAEVKVQTLKATQEARIALNEAIGGLANDGEVRLSPNAVAPIERVQRETFEQAIEPPQAPASANMPVVYPRDLNAFIDAEVLRDQRQRVQDTFVRMRDKMEALRDEFPPELLDVLDGALAKNDAEGWANLRAAIDVAEAVDEVPDGVSQLLSDFDMAFNTPALRGLSDPTLPGYLRQEYANGVTFYRTQRLDRLKDSERQALSGGEGDALEPVMLKALQDVIAEKDRQLALSGAAQMNIDASPARPEATPQGRSEAEAKVAKPENYKALADQYRVDPEAGTFPEEAELRQLAQEGRLSEEDMAVLDDADGAWQDSVAYGEALKSTANCLI